MPTVYIPYKAPYTYDYSNQTANILPWDSPEALSIDYGTRSLLSHKSSFYPCSKPVDYKSYHQSYRRQYSKGQYRILDCPRRVHRFYVRFALSLLRACSMRCPCIVLLSTTILREWLKVRSMKIELNAAFARALRNHLITQKRDASRISSSRFGYPTRGRYPVRDFQSGRD